MRLATFLSAEGRDKLVELTTQNTLDLLTILKWNAANNIFLFRLSSEVRLPARPWCVAHTC